MRIRSLLAIASLIAAPLPALAANDTITVTITSVAAGCSGGCTRVLNGPAGVNLLPLIVLAYQQPCNTSINGTCTPAQVFSYFMGVIGSNLKADILTAQQAAAAAGVTPVPVQ